MWLVHFSSQAAVGNSIMNDRLVRLAAWLLEELGPYGDTRGWGWGGDGSQPLHREHRQVHTFMNRGGPVQPGMLALAQRGTK